MLRWGWLVLSLFLISVPTVASDLVQEQKNALEIKESLVVGKAISLKGGDQEFLAIHAEAIATEAKGGVILLHGMGGNPAWTAVVQPLRLGLPEHGWEVLSLQMPVAPIGSASWAYDTLVAEAAPRVTAAIEFLKQRKIKKIVIVGHSMGARMGLESIAPGVSKEVVAFVAVGTPTNRGDAEAGVLGALKKIKLPILDIYGGRDIPSVLKGAKARLGAAKQAGNSSYRQLEVPGADHFFTGLEDGLLSRVNGWVSRQVTESRDVAEDNPEANKQQK